MSQDQAKKFLEQVNEDKELQKKYKVCFSVEGESGQPSVEEVIAKVVKMAKEDGFEFSEAEARSLYADSLLEEEAELSDADLEDIAGGAKGWNGGKKMNKEEKDSWREFLKQAMIKRYEWRQRQG